MKIELKSKEIFNFSYLHLNKRTIGVFEGLFFLSQRDRETLINTAKLIWERILEKTKVENFLGVIRFDFVPEIEKILKIDKNSLDLGDIKIKGIYEVNVHSPECGAAIVTLHKLMPWLKKHQPNPAFLISKAIKQTIGDRKIIFVPGKGVVKKEWGKYFYEELRNFLEILWMEEEVVMNSQIDQSEVIWRWGDARINGPSEYSLEFILWLLKHPGIIFNTIPKSSNEDLGNKIFLMPEEGENEWNALVGQNFLLSSEILEFSIKNRERLVLKPLLGSSGNNIFFGKNYSEAQWENLLRKFIFRGYGIFEARWLSPIELFGKKIVFDLNSTFWATGKKLIYLYSVVRIDTLENYSKRYVINVTQGGGFAGACVEE